MINNYKKLVSFVNSLEKESKAIILYCWKNDWAPIKELSKFIAAKNDSYTLFKIKEVINTEALKLFDKPALVFKEKAVDPLTKEIVTFAWWFNFETPKKEIFRIRIKA